MGTGAEVVLVASALAGAASTAYSMKQAGDQKKDAERKAREQAEQQKKLEDEMRQKQKDEESLAEANRSRDAVRNRQKMMQGQNGGRASTILSGSLGLTDEANTSKKSLLGM